MLWILLALLVAIDFASPLYRTEDYVKIKFSHKRGFYNSTFNLTMISEFPNQTSIKYYIGGLGKLAGSDTWPNSIGALLYKGENITITSSCM